MTLPKSARTTGRWLGLLGFAISVGVVVHAQTRQPAEQPEQSEASEQTDTAATKPIFRAGITLVTTDVIVRDGDGTFIPDISPDEFIVKENGVLQEVVSLVLVQGGRVYNQLNPPQVVQEGIILPPTRRSNDTAGRIIVLFVDDLHLQTGLTPKVRQVFRQITDNLIHEGDLFGIVSSGPSSLSIDLTYDRSIIPDAEGRIMGDGFSPRELIQQLSSGLEGPSELRFRSHQAMKTVSRTLEGLEKVQNRRKVFIYLSSGYDYNPFELERSFGSGLGRDGRPGDGFNLASDQSDYLGQGPQQNPFNDRNQAVFADTDLAIDIAELARSANRANVSFYTVDPRGLVAGPDLDFDLRAEGFNQYLFRTQNSLRQLAFMTGGKAIVNRNDFDDAAREIDAETSDYYVLGFYTNNPDPTARTRRLEITVDREELEVQSRTSYTFARPPDEAIE